MTTVLAWIGGIVLGAVAVVGLLYLYAFVTWIWYWRFGKGRRLLP